MHSLSVYQIIVKNQFIYKKTLKHSHVYHINYCYPSFTSLEKIHVLDQFYPNKTCLTVFSYNWK